MGVPAPEIRVPLIPPTPSQMRGEWRKCCSSARVAWRKNRGEGKKAKKAREGEREEGRRKRKISGVEKGNRESHDLRVHCP